MLSYINPCFRFFDYLWGIAFKFLNDIFQGALHFEFIEFVPIEVLEEKMVLDVWEAFSAKSTFRVDFQKWVYQMFSFWRYDNTFFPFPFFLILQASLPELIRNDLPCAVEPIQEDHLIKKYSKPPQINQPIVNYIKMTNYSDPQ